MNLALAAAAMVLGVAPGVGYVYPPVLPVGAETEVQLGGYDFTPDVAFHSLDSGVVIEPSGPLGGFIVPGPPYWFGHKSRTTAFPIPREVPARIRVTAGMPSGAVRWQASHAGGASPCAVFLVETGNIVVEQRHRDDSQPLKLLPVTVAGRLERISEVDNYHFTAAEDGLLTMELIARRIGSDLNGAMEIRDADGNYLTDVADTNGHDCHLTLAVTKGARYSISLHDVDFRGNRALVYALRFTLGPQVLLTRPTTGRGGETGEVVFVGYGLKTGGAQIEQVTRTVEFPEQDEPKFSYLLVTPKGNAAVELGLSDIKETVEPRSTDISEAVAINGTMEKVGDEDRYTLELAAGDVWSLSVAARSIGSPLIPTLRVLGPDGSEVVKSAETAETVDCEVVVHASTAGPHAIIVGDISARVDSPLSVYRLTARPTRADFILSIPQRVSVEAGGKASVAVKATRIGGYAGEIGLEVAGLPSDVTVPDDLLIPTDKEELQIEFTAVADCVITPTQIRIIGTGKIGEDDVRHAAMANVEGDLSPRDPSENRVPELLLSTTLKAPFTIGWVGRETQHERPRGSTFPAELEIKSDDGFEGEMQLVMKAQQARHRQGIRGPILDVPAGAKRVFYPVFLPEWLETDRTSRMMVLAMATVRDAQGNGHCVLAPSGRLCMILEGSLMKVDAGDAEIETSPGETFEVPVNISRRPKFREDVSLEIVVSDDVATLFHAKPIVVSPGETHASVQVTTTTDPGLYSEQQLTIRATALEDGRWLAVSETSVTVLFDEQIAVR